MDFDVSAPALIDAGGAFLFLVEGIAILLLARRSRLGVLVGGFAACFGLSYVLVNVLDHEVDPASAALVFTPAIAAVVLLGLLLLHLGRESSPAGRRRTLWFTAALMPALVLAGLAIAIQGGPREIGIAVLPLIWLVEPLLLLLLVGSVLLRAGDEQGAGPYRARVLLGLSAGLFGVFIDMASAVTLSTASVVPALLIDAAGLLLGLLVSAAAWLVWMARPAGADRFARGAFWAILVVGLAGCIHAVLGTDFGAYGIIRAIGAVLLAMAVIKHGLLDVRLPRIVARRGVLAGAALASLFVVAQVMQNFLGAEYGLVTGGVVAGVFLFAANPIQRAVERLAAGEVAGGSAPSARASDSASQEGAFRDAVRLALKDRRFDRSEELALANLADRLGLSARRATEIRHEVEKEKGVA